MFLNGFGIEYVPWLFGWTKWSHQNEICNPTHEKKQRKKLSERDEILEYRNNKKYEKYFLTCFINPIYFPFEYNC